MSDDYSIAKQPSRVKENHEKLNLDKNSPCLHDEKIRHPNLYEIRMKEKIKNKIQTN